MKYTLIAFILLLAAAIYGYGAADTNYAFRIDCELQAAGSQSLPDLTWIQGQSPVIEARVLRNGKAVTADSNTVVRMLIASNGTTATSYSVATNWLAAGTNTVTSFWLPWGIVGTNTWGTNSEARAWWYTVFFERSGYRYWTGSGNLYIEKSTATGDGLTWCNPTSLTYVAWENVQGSPINNPALVSYVNSAAGADETAREDASNAQATADAAFGLASNNPPQASISIWTDAETNYFMKSIDGSLNATGTSFSALMNSALTPGWDGAAIDLGPTRCADGSYVAYEIDAPITNSGGGSFTLRGHGWYGTMVRVKAGYTGSLITITGSESVVNISGIQFLGTAGRSAENTNDFIALYGKGTLLMDDCYFGYVRGTHIRYNMTMGGGIRSHIKNTKFYSEYILGGKPVVVLEQTNASFTSDFMLQGNHFLTATSTCAVSISGQVDCVMFSDNYVLMASQASTGVVFRGGGFHLVADNIFAGTASGGCFVDFSPSMSNEFRTLVVGNNTCGGATTNIVHANSNSYSVVLLANRWGEGQTPTMGENIGGYVLNDYGTTAASACRGDWGAWSSNTAWQAWTNSLTNAANLSAHEIDENAHGLDVVKGDLTKASALAWSNSLGFVEPYHVAPSANIVLNPSNGLIQDCIASGVVVTQLSIISMPSNVDVQLKFNIFSTNSVLITNPVITSGTWSATEVNPLYYSKPSCTTNYILRRQ